MMAAMHSDSPTPLHLVDGAPAKAQDALLAKLLLDWYDRHGRDLLWRVRDGRSDPYRVWLSEIMLQQTTVATVGPYFTRFLERWPTVAALAAASLNDVLVSWAGLGYYARARNLHRCAQMLVAQHGGRFPETEAALRALPGIGDYTAAAIAAIAFDQRAVVMDGNIERVMARLFAISDPLPAAKPRLKALAARLTPERRPGDYAQAAMDLGATVCTPKKPACALCPWRPVCRAAAAGIAEALPVKAEKAVRPVRHGVAFWVQNESGAVLLRRRRAEGLLGGMMEIPSTPWRAAPWRWPDAGTEAPLRAVWRKLPGVVSHSFTHFHLELVVVSACLPGTPGTAGEWCALDALPHQALPSLMRKVARHATLAVRF
jgi:A/G-specific adenine glycosylase